MTSTEPLDSLLSRIRACTVCEKHLQDGVRPVIRASTTARLVIVGQAPGLRVHNSGLPFNDASGDRLRSWLGIDRETFYDETRVAIVPMGFCFPGYDAKGHDLPPRRECAATWRNELFELLPVFSLTLLVGSYAMQWHLGKKAKRNLTETVLAWRDYIPRYVPLPHPSWRNNAWVKRNPPFERELVPYLQRRVRKVLNA